MSIEIGNNSVLRREAITAIALIALTGCTAPDYADPAALKAAAACASNLELEAQLYELSAKIGQNEEHSKDDGIKASRLHVAAKIAAEEMIACADGPVKDEPVFTPLVFAYTESLGLKRVVPGPACQDQVDLIRKKYNLQPSESYAEVTKEKGVLVNILGQIQQGQKSKVLEEFEEANC